MGLHLKFIGFATIDHINVRKQGNEDDNVLAMDIKLAGMVSAKALNDLLGAGSEDLSSMFWDLADTREDADLLTHAIDNIKLDVKWAGCDVSLGRHKIIADVKKPAFRPRGGRLLSLVITATIEDPKQNLVDYLVHRMKENVVCEIQTQPELFGNGVAA